MTTRGTTRLRLLADELERHSLDPIEAGVEDGGILRARVTPSEFRRVTGTRQARIVRFEDRDHARLEATVGALAVQCIVTKNEAERMVVHGITNAR